MESTITAFFLSKINALVFSLGGALLALSFRDDAERSYLIGAINLMGSWFIGFSMGDAISHHYQLTGGTENFMFVVSASIGLLLIGGMQKLARSFFADPVGFIQQALELFKRSK